jgi:hypothetical protein
MRVMMRIDFFIVDQNEGMVCPVHLENIILIVCE